MSDVKKSAAEKAAEIIQNYDGPPIRIMEVCGTHTHDIFRLGIRAQIRRAQNLTAGALEIAFTDRVQHCHQASLRRFRWR